MIRTERNHLEDSRSHAPFKLAGFDSKATSGSAEVVWVGLGVVGWFS